MIFACGAGAAFIIRAYFSRSLEAEKELIGLIDHIRSKIMYFNEPIKDIYASYDCFVLSETGFTEEAWENGWCRGIELLKKKNVISTGFADAVYGFGYKLGNRFSEEEINNCNYYISKGTEALEKDKSELPGKSKLYSVFSIAGSLIAAVILI